MAIHGLVQLLIYLIVCGLIVYVVYWILGLLSLPEPVRTVIGVLVAVVVLLWLLSTLGFW